MFLLSYDTSSSSVRASLVDAEIGKCAASAFSPKTETGIITVRPGWAKQEPESWWENLKLSTRSILSGSRIGTKDIRAIGIFYQMHSLVCVDKRQRALHPAIIWCDSRAVSYGQRTFEAVGEKFCLARLPNSPRNFAASKLAWMKESESGIYEQIDKIILPGDCVAMKLNGEAYTAIEGFSEGMLWGFRNNRPTDFLMQYYRVDPSLITDIRFTPAEQGRLTSTAARELELQEGAPVTYRVGDQPNNTLSLNVFNPGGIVSTAGTSRVVYGVNGEISYDPQLRVNTFAHVDHTAAGSRLGVLLCINGMGILNSWIRRNVAPEGISYAGMNCFALSVPIGGADINIPPFGNGAERMLNNRTTGCGTCGIDSNRHDKSHLIRAAREGIVFSFRYGIDAMEEMGTPIKKIHAGHVNMFLSSVFHEISTGTTGATIELYDTDSSVGVAKGAGMGTNIYKDHEETFAILDKLTVVEPDTGKQQEYTDAHVRQKRCLTQFVQTKIENR